MDKQKKIDEMAEILGGVNPYPHRNPFSVYGWKKFASVLHDAGYRKIPEGAVVISREYYESEAYARLIENELCKKCRERVAEAYEKVRQETAERIYKLADEIATGSQNDGVNILCAIKKEFGL